MDAPIRTPLRYAEPDGRGIERLREVEVEIHDGRAADLPGWQECGFELVSHDSVVADWTDDETIAAVHYGEIEELARQLTGCDAALVSDHVRRSGEEERRPRDQAPVRLVHSDFAGDYADVVRGSYFGVKGRGAVTLARSGLTAEEIAAAPRIVMMQFWRNVGPPRMDLPVAFCDSRTVTPSDALPFHYTGYLAGGRRFDALAIVAPRDAGQHRWFTFPDMTSGEVVAFRTYDSALVAENRTWFTPHSAFPDPRVEPGRPARCSVELRVLCLFR